jgi:hypothetical protein
VDGSRSAAEVAADVERLLTGPVLMSLGRR